MTWKRTFIAAAVGANLVVFAAPGMVCFYLAIDSQSPSGALLSSGDRLMFASIGFVLLVFGLFNLGCLYSACKSNGLERGNSIGLGVVSCGLMTMATLAALAASTALFRGPTNLLPTLLLGTVTFTTAGAFWQLRRSASPDWQCPHCDYDLRGLEGRTEGGGNGVCPECGFDKAQRDAIADQ